MRVARHEFEGARLLVEGQPDAHLLARGVLDRVRDRLLDEAVDRGPLECPAAVEHLGADRVEVAQLDGVPALGDEAVDVGIDDGALIVAAEHGEDLAEFDARTACAVGDEARVLPHLLRVEVLADGQSAGVHGDDGEVVGERIVHVAGDAAAHLVDGAVLSGTFAQQGLGGGVDEALFAGTPDDADDDEHGEHGAVDEEEREFEGADGLRSEDVGRRLGGHGGGEAHEVEGPAAPGRERDEDEGGREGAEDADGADEDPGDPHGDRNPAAGSALQGFDGAVGGEEILPAVAAGGEELAQLLGREDLRPQLSARDPAAVADQDDRQAGEGDETEADVEEEFGAECAGFGTGVLGLRPFGPDDDDEHEHADESGDACPEEGMHEGAAAGARCHTSTLPGQRRRRCRPKG